MIGALVLGLGCGGSQVEPPGDESGSQGAESTAGTPDSTTATDGPTGTATESGGASESGEGTATDTGALACVGPDGCFDCTPEKPLELLNACTDAACAPFANTKDRLPLLADDGSLPPLP